MTLIWTLKPAVFSDSDERLALAAQDAGHNVRLWRDEWLDGNAPCLDQKTVVFHGSLGCAARIRTELPWEPGALCEDQAFHCSSWYGHAQPREEN